MNIHLPESIEISRVIEDLTDKQEFEALFDAAQAAFPDAVADQADLSGFAAHGGKLILDHGIDDPLIPVEGTLNYYKRMRETMGAVSVDSFCRLYCSPGDNHGNCHGNGPGISESDGVRALMDWVERGKAPEALRTVQIDRKTGEKRKERVLDPVREV